MPAAFGVPDDSNVERGGFEQVADEQRVVVDVAHEQAGQQDETKSGAFVVDGSGNQIHEVATTRQPSQ